MNRSVPSGVMLTVVSRSWNKFLRMHRQPRPEVRLRAVLVSLSRKMIVLSATLNLITTRARFIAKLNAEQIFTRYFIFPFDLLCLTPVISPTRKGPFNFIKFIRRLASTNGQQLRALVMLPALCAGNHGKETAMPMRPWLKGRLEMRAM